VTDVVLIDRTDDVDGVQVHVVVTRSLEYVDRQPLLRDEAIVRAAHAGCGGLEVEAAAGSYFFTLGRQDATTGHTAFDDRYIVKASDEVALRYWLGADEADTLLSTYDPHAANPFRLKVDARELRLSASCQIGNWTAPEGVAADEHLGRVEPGEHPWLTAPIQISRLDEAVRAVGVLAGRGARLAASWRDLLTPLGAIESDPIWRADGQYRLSIERGRRPVQVDFPWHLSPLRRDGLRTRLSIAWPDDSNAVIWPRTWSRWSRPTLDRARDLDLPAPWHGIGRAAEPLLGLPQLPAALTAAGVDWLLAGEGRLAIGWERIVDEREPLAAAIALLTRWAEHRAQATGPYR
jgi:hypothetical protein